MRTTLGSLAALAVMVGISQTSPFDPASAAKYEVTIRPGLVYAEHDGTGLVGDLYLPKGRAKAPALVAMHGGAWRAGNRAFYKYWGSFLARNGYALFSIDYRLGKPGTYPAAVYDVKAAVQFVRAKAAAFDINPDRIGLMGDSAGAQLAALLALAGDRFTSAHRDDPYAATDINVKAVVGFYGIYDMLTQWNHDTRAQRRQELLAQRNQDLIRRPGDNITEEFLGVSPMQNQQIYAEIIADQLRHCRSQARAFPALSWQQRPTRRSTRPVGRLPCGTHAGRIFCAADHDPRRRPLLGIRAVRRRTPQLRCGGGAAAVAISRKLAVRKVSDTPSAAAHRTDSL